MRVTTLSRLSLSEKTNSRSGTNGAWIRILLPPRTANFDFMGVNTLNPDSASCLYAGIFALGRFRSRITNHCGWVSIAGSIMWLMVWFGQNLLFLLRDAAVYHSSSYAYEAKSSAYMFSKKFDMSSFKNKVNFQ